MKFVLSYEKLFGNMQATYIKINTERSYLSLISMQYNDTHFFLVSFNTLISMSYQGRMIDITSSNGYDL